MPQLLTKRLGEIQYSEDSVFAFPTGVPGFENERSFLFVRKPDMEPIIFMQSMSDRDLCFILLPILVADPSYRLELNWEDARKLQIPDHPRIGDDVLCAALVCAGENVTPTVNLMAPIVVNLRNRTGMQVIRADSGYSHRFPLLVEEQLTCS